MLKKEWINDSLIHCKTCDSISKSYYLDDCGQTNFCPNCGSGNIEAYEEDDN